MFQLVEVGNPLRLADGPLFDSFGRLRVSQPESVFDSKHLRGFLENGYWDSSTASGGTVAINANFSAVDLTLTTTNGSSAIWQTKEYFVYQAGKSHQILMTFVAGAAKANVRKRMGYFDANDGVFLEQTTTDIRFVIRSSTTGSPVDTNFAAQASWSVDPLNGSGPSGITLDLSKSQIMFIDFQWLGVGRVRVGFVIDGVGYIAHEFKHANSTVGVYCKNPNLPIRYEIVNTAGSASGTTLQAICSMLASEGGRNLRGMAMSADMFTTGKTAASGVLTPMICVRLKAAQIRTPLLPVSFSLLSQSANPVVIRVFILRAGGTHVLTGASFNSAHALSSAEFDVAASALTIGNAIPIYADSTSPQTRSLSGDLAGSDSLKVCANIAAVSDILCVAAAGVGGNALNTIVQLNWLEEI